jgi:hypothetical protein
MPVFRARPRTPVGVSAYADVMREAAGLADVADHGVDVEILFSDTGATDASSGKPIALTALEDMAKIVMEEIEVELGKLAPVMIADLRHLYQAQLREAPRREGKPLQQVILESMLSQVSQSQYEAELGVFDIGRAASQTRGPAYHTKGFWSLFDLLEEGRHGLVPASRTWAFISRARAMRIAEAAVQWARGRLGWDDARARSFLTQIWKRFRGNTIGTPDEEGIMVQLDQPLFFQLPAWGGDPNEPQVRRAGEFTRPGMPRPALNVLRTYRGPSTLTDGSENGLGWLHRLVAPAFERAAQRITGG